MSKIELYVNENHPQTNADIQYLHLSHITTVDNASCDDIELNNCLDYALERGEILPVVISKLRYGGVIKISGVDLTTVMEDGSRCIIGLAQIQQLLYAGRMSCDTYENTIAKLKNAQLTILHEVLDDQHYFITAARNLPSE